MSLPLKMTSLRPQSAFWMDSDSGSQNSKIELSYPELIIDPSSLVLLELASDNRHSATSNGMF